MSNDRWIAEFLAGPACPGCGMTHGMVPASPGDSMANHRPLGLWPDFARCLHCRHFSEVPAIVSRTWARFALLVARGEVPYTCAGCTRWLDLCCCDERDGRLCKWCDAPVDDERPWHCEECEDCYNVSEWAYPDRAEWACARLASGIYTFVHYSNPVIQAVIQSNGVWLSVIAIELFVIRMAPTNRQLAAGPYPRPVPGAGIAYWEPGIPEYPRWYGMPEHGDQAVATFHQDDVDGVLDRGVQYPHNRYRSGGMLHVDIIRQAFGK